MSSTTFTVRVETDVKKRLGFEDESWRRFHEEALPRFFAGTYAGDYMAEQVARFEALLPETPPWKTG